MPQIIPNESDSDSDVIPPKSASKSRASASKKTVSPPIADPEPSDVSQHDESDGEDGEEGEEEYVVEAIKDHRFDGKKLMLQVKWKGYEKKSDMTWEPEDNCEGAPEALNEYFEAIGGRPTYRSPARGNKRGRQSGVGSSATPASTKKRARTSLAASSANLETDDDEEERKWTPPNTKSWEDEVTAIDTIEKAQNDQLICYVQWKNGKKSQHPIEDIYKKCPQRMLAFYEQHLVFKETGTL